MHSEIDKTVKLVLETIGDLIAEGHLTGEGLKNLSETLHVLSEIKKAYSR